MKARLNIVISGGTGAGKTTLLNALSSAVPDGERIITVEDNAELRLQQPHVVTLEARPPNVEGKGEITIRDLVRNSLRMRPDRIIVGEVRGAETVDMLQALNTGHEGSLVTLHANSCDDAIHRLSTLASMSELQIPFEALRDQINSAIDVIVQVDRYADGKRRLSEVAVVASARREAFRLSSVMEFMTEPVDVDRKVRGVVEHRRAARGGPAPRAAGRRGPAGRLHGRAARARGGRMTSATWAMLLLVATGALGTARSLAAAGRREPQRGAGGARARRRRRRRRAQRRARARRAAAPDRPGPAAGGVGRRRRDQAAADRAGRARGRRPRRSASCSSRTCSPRCLALIVAVGGSVAVTRAFIERRRGNRRDLFVGQLPEIARMLSNGTAAGLSMPQAVRMASRELADPAGAELRRVVEEMQVGRPVEDALEALRERLPSREVAVLMSTVAIQQRAGGDTVRALGGARRRRSRRARSCGARSSRCCRASSTRPTSSPRWAPGRSC